MRKGTKLDYNIWRRGELVERRKKRGHERIIRRKYTGELGKERIAGKKT